MRNYWREWFNSNNRNVFLVLAVTFTVNENTTGYLFYIVKKNRTISISTRSILSDTLLSIKINSIVEVLTDTR